MTVGMIGPEAGVAVPALTAVLLGDADHAVRVASALALTKMDPKASEMAEAAPALGKALSDEDPSVRMYAAMALGRLGERARPAVPALIRALRDDANQTNADAFHFTGEFKSQNVRFPWGWRIRAFALQRIRAIQRGGAHAHQRLVCCRDWIGDIYRKESPMRFAIRLGFLVAALAASVATLAGAAFASPGGGHGSGRVVFVMTDNTNGNQVGA